MNIVLIGMRGSGKTTIGSLLAHELDRELVEMDNLIAERAGMGIAEIVAKQGWSKFRDIEDEITAEVSKMENADTRWRGILAMSRPWPSIHREILPSPLLWTQH